LLAKYKNGEVATEYAKRNIGIIDILFSEIKVIHQRKTTPIHPVINTELYKSTRNVVHAIPALFFLLLKNTNIGARASVGRETIHHHQGDCPPVFGPF
jgi:hypothetical protein